MTFKQMWDALIKRNPKLRDPDAQTTLQNTSIRRMLQQAYEIGGTHERENASVDPLSDLFSAGK